MKKRVPERRLFHGSPACWTIAKQGFKLKYSGDGMFGKGNYQYIVHVKFHLLASHAMLVSHSFPIIKIQIILIVFNKSRELLKLINLNT